MRPVCGKCPLGVHSLDQPDAFTFEFLGVGSNQAFDVAGFWCPRWGGKGRAGHPVRPAGDRGRDLPVQALAAGPRVRTMIPGRRGSHTDSMRDCCTSTRPGHLEEVGWWTLCPAHEDADRLMRASDRFRARLHTATNGHLEPERSGDPRPADRTLRAAAEAAGAGDGRDLFVLRPDPALARRFLDALQIPLWLLST